MKKGTSSKPLILGILGFLSALPNALISLLSSTYILEASTTNTNTSAENTEMVFLYLKIIFWSALIGFIVSLFTKRLYFIAGPIMIVAGLLIFIGMATGNIFLIFPASFFIVGGIICFTQKKISKNQIIVNQ